MTRRKEFPNNFFVCFVYLLKGKKHKNEVPMKWKNPTGTSQLLIYRLRDDDDDEIHIHFVTRLCMDVINRVRAHFLHGSKSLIIV